MKLWKKDLRLEKALNIKRKEKIMAKSKRQKILKAIEEFEKILMLSKASILDKHEEEIKRLEKRTEELLEREEELLGNSFFKAFKEDIEKNKDYYTSYAQSTQKNDEINILLKSLKRIKMPKDYDLKTYQKLKQLIHKKNKNKGTNNAK